MKYKNLQEKIENIDLDNLSEDDVLQIETTIKELDKIKDITLLENSIRFLSSLGIKHIIINSHYLYKDIKNFVKEKNIEIVDRK